MAYEGIWADQATEDRVNQLRADARAKSGSQLSNSNVVQAIQAPPPPSSPTSAPQPPATPPPSPTAPPQSSTESPNMSNNNQFKYNVNQDKRLGKVQQNLSDNQAIAADNRTLYNDYQQKGYESAIKRINNQSAARQGLKDNQFDFNDLNQYNSAAAGNKAFGMADVKYLKKRGVSDDAIKAHIQSLGGKGVGEDIRYNKDYAGNSYVGDMGNAGDISNFDVGKGYNITDINYLRNQGYSDKQIADDMIKRNDKGFGAASAKFLNDQGRLEEWKEAKERAQNSQNNQNTTVNQDGYGNINVDKSVGDTTNTNIDNSLTDNSLTDNSMTDNSISDSNNTDINDSFNTDINNDNNVNNSVNTTIGDNNSFGAGANIGNNNSVTITNQGGGTNTGLNNMQSMAAYQALNNNQYAQSSGFLNGYGRSAGAVSEAEKALGVRDRVANIYNMQGLTQKYWNDKAISHQADYLGDIWKNSGFDYKMPGLYKPPEDKTEEIAGDLDFD